MPRRTPCRKTIEKWIHDFPELVFNGSELQCTLCNIYLDCKRKSTVLEHIATEKHNSVKCGEVSARDKQKDFNVALMKLMISCNIPWRQLNFPMLRDFIENCVSGKYSGVNVPDESTLRKLYLPNLNTTVKDGIRSDLKGKNLWLSVDETTTAGGWKIAHVVAGALEENFATRSHLIASKVIEHTNAEAIAEIVTDSLAELWGDEYEANKYKFVLLITDDTAYMEAAGRVLKEKYNILHLTCLAHGLHRVAEIVRECYPNVDTLITSVKKVFLKTPERCKLFSEKFPNTPLPPEPIITRCSTWLEAASYYYCYFSDIKTIIEDLDPSQSVAIAQAQDVFQDTTLYQNLHDIHASYSRLPSSIKKLEQRPHTDKFCITDAVAIVWDLRYYLWRLSGTIPETVKRKFTSVFDNNPGFRTISLIVDLLNKKEVEVSSADNICHLRLFPYFKYAPVTSCDTERSFSQLKWIFSDKRQSITTEHLENILLVYYYYDQSRET